MNQTDRALLVVITFLLLLPPIVTMLKPETETVTKLSPVTISVTETHTTTLTQSETITDKRIIYVKEGFLRGEVFPTNISFDGGEITSIYFAKWGSKVVVGINITLTCNGGEKTTILKINKRYLPMDGKTALSIVGDFPISINGKIYCQDPTWFFFVLPSTEEKYVLSLGIVGEFGEKTVDLTPTINKIEQEYGTKTESP